jgi:hypothetical protein
LYPLFREEDDEPSIPVLKGTIKVDGKDYDIDVHILRLPFVFEDDEEMIKNRLANVINSIFN